MERGSFSLRGGRLIPERQDGLIELYYNEVSGIKEMVEVTGGKNPQAWDEIYIQPADDERKPQSVPGHNTFLAKGKLTTIVDGVPKGEEKEINILIYRKKR